MKNVLLIDSGSGGINILKECVKITSGCNFLMFCDQINLPYGNKSLEELQQITLENLHKIRSFFPFEIVVLACNTLTCSCLQVCREKFPDVVFIGTVPAVKPALEKYDAKDVLVLATDVTIKHNTLINKTPNLLLKAMPKLASEIDLNLDALDNLRTHILQELSEFQKKAPKAVVLGCTHYLAVKNILQNVLGRDVEFFDSANGVARRLKHFVGESEPSFQVQFMVTGKENTLPLFWHYFSSSSFK